MPLDLFPRTDIFTNFTHCILTLKPRKAQYYWTFDTLTSQPLTSILPSQRVLRGGDSYQELAACIF